MLVFELAVILLMLAANALFAAYEMALASVSRARLMALAQQQAPGAEAAVHMKERLEASLAVVQLGITLAGAVAAAVGGAGAEETVAPLLQSSLGLPGHWADIAAVACVVVPLSAGTILFAELIPKTFAIANSEWVCLLLSPAMRFMALVAHPVIRIFEGAVKALIRTRRQPRLPDGTRAEGKELHELHAAVSLARNARLIGAREEKIVLSAARLASRRISEIMLAASDISAIHADCNLTEALIQAHLDLHTRFPVCGKAGDPQTIEGYVNFKDIIVALKMSPGLGGVRGIMRAIKRIDASATMAQAIEEMLQDNAHIALVMSKDQRTLGMVTIQDILKELVGHIGDEFDVLPTHLNRAGSGWVVGGGASMTAVAAAAGMPPPKAAPGERSATLAQWLRQKGGRPKGGDTIAAGGLIVTVRKLRRHKVAEAFVAVNAADAGKIE